MIRINLAKRRKGGGAGGKGFDLSNLFSFLKPSSGGGSSGDTDKFDFRKSALVRAVALVVVCYLVDGMLADQRQERLNAIAKQLAVVESESSAIQAKLTKLKGYEPIKKQLEEDERTIRTKLEVINRLLENRGGPPKMLIQVAQVIPEEVWLTELRVTEESVKFAGATTGYNQVSDFLRSLSDSSQFTDIGLSAIQETTTAQKEQRTQTFEINAKRRPQQ